MGSSAAKYLRPLEQFPTHPGTGEPRRDTGTHRERPGGGSSSRLQLAEHLADRRFGAGSEDGRSRRRSRSQEEGTAEAGARGELRGQKRISSAHCCRVGSGAAPSPAS